MNRTKRVVILLSAIIAASSCTMPVEDGPDVEIGSQSAALAAPCSCAKVNEVLATATGTTPNVWLDCSLTPSSVAACSRTLSSSTVITKRIVIEGSAASGLTLDCNGARIDGTASGNATLSSENANKDMIEIKSQEIPPTVSGAQPTWQRPTDITIKNCDVIGSVRIWGMSKNGEGEYLRESSHSSGHATRARNAAPTRITLDNLTITGRARVPLYFAPGVTYSKLVSSEINGESDGAAVYFDAESSANVLKNNKIHPDTSSRELIAIDASSNNEIIDNWFSALDNGGIYLYRNCGEGGTVRHTTPSSNTIINNIFYYDAYNGGNPSVYLGARNGNRDYCDDDDGYPFGSSASNYDYSQYNYVMQNQIYKRSISISIREGRSTDSPNYIKYNTTVTTAVSRLAGCYLPNAYFSDFLSHGTYAEVFRGANGVPTCTGYRYTCNDGHLTATTTTTCSISKVDMGCQMSNNNAGCQTAAFCPAGRRIIGAVGACNLESGTIDAATVSQIPINLLRVVRASDVVSDGRCWVGYSALSSGETPIAYFPGASSVSLGCYERDSNGGDCHVRGSIYCQ